MNPDAADVHESYEGLYIGPICHVQTAEDRFGRDVLDDLKAFVHGTLHANDMGFLDDVIESENDIVENEEVTLADDEMFEDGFDWLAELAPAEDVGVGTDQSHAHGQLGFPKIATTRNNLTALSQRYNLYLAAYQDTIHVYQPRRAGPQILPPPSLILHPKPSRHVKDCQGAVDQQFPHQINHLIVGNLGDMEIVLFAYDDGDVAAYYTHAVLHSVVKANRNQAHGGGGSPTRHTAYPRLFFHENVGASAWGLAIHQQSRLVAVGSNAHEVTVFAFAVTRSGVAVSFPEVDLSPLEPDKMALERHFRARTRTWRIILPLGPAGHNIPNVSFVDDEAGEADKVAAMDVLGNVWLLDIWKIGALPIWWPDPQAREHRGQSWNFKGWGVLFLRDSSFKPAKTVRESLGVPGNEVITVTRPRETRAWLDTTCSMYYVKELSSDTDALIRRRRGPTDYVEAHSTEPSHSEDDTFEGWETDSDSEDEGVDMTAPMDAARSRSAHPPATAGNQDWQESELADFSRTPDTCLDDISGEIQLGRCIVPTLGQTPSPGKKAHGCVSAPQAGSGQQHDTKHIDFVKADLPSHLAKHHFLLRTTFTDIELQPFDRAAPCVECKYALTLHYSPPDPGDLAPALPWDLNTMYAERISMLLHVPELSLVVAGSPSGRVALITLTKTAMRRHLSHLRYGFRIDRVLPRKAEDEKRLRPRCTLIGVAVSPVPYRPACGNELGLPSAVEGAKREPAVYRLILHYKDHRILMYDIARRMNDGELLIY